MNRTLLSVVIALFVGLGIGYVVHRPADSMATMATSASADPAVLYWYDPMRPDQHFDKPGKSPFMDMQLVPKKAEGGGISSDTGGVSVNARMAQNLGIRTALVERGTTAASITVAGTVAYDDSANEVVQARTRGYLEHVFVRKPLTAVHRGQALADLVAPDWASAAAEYRALRGLSGANIDSLRTAARQRLITLGLPEGAIRHIDKTGEVSTHVTLVAPRDGVIAELDAREGQAVEPGMPLFRINGLATVWINADVPEAQSAGLREGAPVSITVSAWPGRHFDGAVSAILPQVEAMTRTLRVRVELANPDGALVPGMFAQVSLENPASEAQLSVPSEAVIRTGERTVLIVAESEGHFRPVDVKTGAEANGKTVILDGLEDGSRVVVSGQFLIDSEANLRGSLSRMSAPASEKNP